jgi:YfiH family protein
MPLDVSCWTPAEAPWPAGVRAGFTWRTGGVSAAPWDSLNLGDHVGDDPAAVRQNRARLAQSSALSGRYLRQVHGSDVVRLTPQSPDGLVADACWTESPGVAAVILVADCLPVLLCSPDGQQVAAAHAGWRGLAGADGQGVLEALCSTLCQHNGLSDLSGWVAWLGPCIGPTAFEVGSDVRDALIAGNPEANTCFTPVGATSEGPPFWADLPALAHQRLARCGITDIHGNHGSVEWCTFSDSRRFFSHRRDARRLGSTGRMAAFIGLVR